MDSFAKKSLGFSRGLGILNNVSLLIVFQRQEHATLTTHLQQKDATVNVLHGQMDTLKAQLSDSHSELQRVKSENAMLMTKSQYAPGFKFSRHFCSVMELMLRRTAVSSVNS